MPRKRKKGAAQNLLSSAVPSRPSSNNKGNAISAPFQSAKGISPTGGGKTIRPTGGGKNIRPTGGIKQSLPGAQKGGSKSVSDLLGGSDKFGKLAPQLSTGGAGPTFTPTAPGQAFTPTAPGQALAQQSAPFQSAKGISPTGDKFGKLAPQLSTGGAGPTFTPTAPGQAFTPTAPGQALAQQSAPTSNTRTRERSGPRTPPATPDEGADQGQAAPQGEGFKEQYGMKKGKFKDKYGKAATNAAKAFIDGGAQVNTEDMTAEELRAGGYVGSAGNLAFDPATGKPIPKKNRKSVELEAAASLAQGDAAKEASDFEFDLEESKVPSIVDKLTSGSASNNPFLQEGNENIRGSIQNLLGTQAGQINAGINAGGDREAALAELQSLQAEALGPNIDPARRQELMRQADDRRAEVNNMQDDLTNLFNRQVSSDNASLAARGVLDSTTAANTLGARESNLGIAANQLMSQANEQSRTDINDETDTQRQAALGLSGIQGQQASSSGGLLAQLLGQQSDIGQSIGQLGLGQGGLGNQASQIDQAGQIAGGELDMANRAQEAGLQSDALNTRLTGDQTQLNNLLGLDAQTFNQLMAKKTLGLNQQLGDQSAPGWLMQLLGIAG